MHDTPPPPPIPARATAILLDDLGVALRNVGVFDSQLPVGDRVRREIEVVCSIKQELDRRAVDVTEFLTALSSETSWRMLDLLDDCLRYPDRLPYVKEADGIRRTLRCHRCARAERPPNAELFWFCKGCLSETLSAMRRRVPLNGIVLFRSYNPECRCEHADADTVLAAQIYVDTIFGYCERCILGELDRRESATVK